MRTIIAICGGSGSGKTYLASFLKDDLHAAILPFDAYYKDQSALPMEERAKLNYDSPETLDIELFLKHLEDLKQGRPIAMPQYDFATHTRKKETVAFAPSDVVIVEGILTLLLSRSCYDYAIYVDADSDIRLARRIRRDVAERGRSVESVLSQYLRFVRPMHLLHVEPEKELCNFVFVNNGEDGLDPQQYAECLTHIRQIVGK